MRIANVPQYSILQWQFYILAVDSVDCSYYCCYCCYHVGLEIERDRVDVDANS